jgi:hypothetical protein
MAVFSDINHADDGTNMICIYSMSFVKLVPSKVLVRFEVFTVVIVMLHHMALVTTDVSEELSVSFIRVTRIIVNHN